MSEPAAKIATKALVAEARILLVDDEPGLRRTLSDRLRKEGYAVDTAANGDSALEAARKAHYDLVILDLNLPTKDGLEVCQELRRDGQQVAVLMLTARDSLADKITGLRSGADDYMTKPFASAELVARIEALLRRMVARGERVQVVLETERGSESISGETIASVFAAIPCRF